MYEIKAIVRPERLPEVVHELHQIGDVPGLTVSIVRGIGRRMPVAAAKAPEYGETDMAKLETVVSDDSLQRVVDAIQKAASTGRVGDGKIVVVRVEHAITLGSRAQDSPPL